MNHQTNRRRATSSAEEAVSEILILADGKIFAHNITPAMARVLTELNPKDEAMSRRVTEKNTLGRTFKILAAGFFLISIGLQPGDIAGAGRVGRFSGFRSGEQAVKTAVPSAPPTTGLKPGANEIAILNANRIFRTHF
jgi:hypothetical protein